MSSSLPAPRPALVRKPNGTVHSAAPHLSSLAVDEAAVAKAAKKHKKKAHAGDDADLIVTLSKRDRKRLRRKADSYGWTAEEAAAHVLRAWSDE
ncbi:hypothetical protein [Jiangella anatolica]|uniref:Uncharacterized protein n=1 Tax=Jiangella anatolica TaxID=2670374 RepID=A0A2W2BWK0_9ACTN|nr:hypothetical protein [Jiangella anatolica]PZF80499.1 hypothetical protein C1I92_25880 [Jiangella anatolica]